jgi:hypothetical protein
MPYLSQFRYWLILTITCFWLGSSLLGNKNFHTIFYSDSEGYYLYLPAVCLYGSFENLPIRTTQEYHPYKDTHKIATRFTCGVAIMMSPFWAISHIYKTKIRGKTTIEPYSVEYGFGILLGSCFYLTLGLFFLFKTLQKHFANPSPRTALFTVIVILFGTNLLYYTIQRPAMSHVYSFCLVSLLLWTLSTFWHQPTLLKSFKIGLFLGLLILIRPTHLVFIPFLLFFDVKTLSELKTRTLICLKFKIKILSIFFIVSICWVPQFMYWYYLTGNFFFYSYENQGFPYLFEPRIISVFFHVCNGFLIYSPVMIFALLGLVQLSKNNRLNSRFTISLFSCVVYICGSWWCWWFGQSYGYRVFIDLYPLLAIGLAYYIENQIKSPIYWLRYTHFIIVILCIFINVRMITTPFQWNIEPDGSNFSDYRKLLKWVFFIGKPL